MKSRTEFSSGSKFLHWFIALIVISMLAAGFFLEDLPSDYIDTAFMLHKSIGIIIFFLMILRLFWIWQTGKPSLPATVSPWEKGLACCVEYALYFLLILMPLSGWIKTMAKGKPPYFFNLFHFPLPGIAMDRSLANVMKQTHYVVALFIIALLLLHITGALKHHFIDKDGVFRSMLPSRKRS